MTTQVHVLVNTVVALPYDPIEKEDDIIAVMDNGRSRMSYPPLHRIASYPPPNQRANSTSRLLGDASDGVPFRPNLKQQVNISPEHRVAHPIAIVRQEKRVNLPRLVTNKHFKFIFSHKS